MKRPARAERGMKTKHNYPCRPPLTRPHARHDTAHIGIARPWTPTCSVLCVWRFPPPKGSRSVRHDPRDAEETSRPRGPRRASRPSLRRRAYICVGRVGLRRDASASRTEQRPEGVVVVGRCLPLGQPLRRLDAHGLGGAREGPLPGALGPGRPRRVEAVPRTRLRPLRTPRRRTSGRGTRRRRGPSRGRPARRRRRRCDGPAASCRGGGRCARRRGRVVVVALPPAAPAPARVVRWWRWAGGGAGAGAGAGLRRGEPPARSASSAASARARAPPRAGPVGQSTALQQSSRRDRARARFEARWRRSVGGGSTVVAA